MKAIICRKCNKTIIEKCHYYYGWEEGSLFRIYRSFPVCIPCYEIINSEIRSERQRILDSHIQKNWYLKHEYTTQEAETDE